MVRSVRKSRVTLASLLYGSIVSAKLIHDAEPGGIGSIVADLTPGWVAIFALFATLTAALAAGGLLALDRRVVSPALLLAGFTVLVARGPVEQTGPGIPLVGNLFVIPIVAAAMAVTGLLEALVRRLLASDS